MTYVYWTNREERALMVHWSAGKDVLLALLPRRTWRSILNKTRYKGYRSPKKSAGPVSCLHAIADNYQHARRTMGPVEAQREWMRHD